MCINTGDISSDCVDNSPAEASLVLARYALERYFRRLTEGQVIKSLALGFADYDQARNALDFQRQLMGIERRAIKTVVAILRAQIQSLMPFEWETGQLAAEKREIARSDERQLQHWQGEAEQEANEGSNWSRARSGNYRFNEGAAYRQLKNISFSGWSGQ